MARSYKWNEVQTAVLEAAQNYFGVDRVYAYKENNKGDIEYRVSTTASLEAEETLKQNEMMLLVVKLPDITIELVSASDYDEDDDEFYGGEYEDSYVNKGMIMVLEVSPEGIHCKPEFQKEVFTEEEYDSGYVHSHCPSFSNSATRSYFIRSLRGNYLELLDYCFGDTPDNHEYVDDLIYTAKNLLGLPKERIISTMEMYFDTILDILRVESTDGGPYLSFKDIACKKDYFQSLASIEDTTNMNPFYNTVFKIFRGLKYPNANAVRIFIIELELQFELKYADTKEFYQDTWSNYFDSLPFPDVMNFIRRAFIRTIIRCLPFSPISLQDFRYDSPEERYEEVAKMLKEIEGFDFLFQLAHVTSKGIYTPNRSIRQGNIEDLKLPVKFNAEYIPVKIQSDKTTIKYLHYPNKDFMVAIYLMFKDCCNELLFI